MNPPPSGSFPASSSDDSDAGLLVMGKGALKSPGSAPASAWVPPAAEALRPHLPDYDIEEFIASGGMGAVYRGVDKSLGRMVAIKILPPDLQDEHPGYVARFKQEARSMAQLNHPAIVAVYDCGEMADGTLYFVMEYINGTDVAQMVATQGRLSSEHAMAITAHVCDALQYAHERGVVHRDIKPANIMISFDGRVKVADFGLARASLGGDSGITRGAPSMGTPHFIAPEALIPGVKVDHRADIYAVGVMLYQMLTGKVPQGIFEMPSFQVPGLDPRYDAIVSNAMREQPERRYQNIHEMRLALDGIMTQPVVKADDTEAAPVPVSGARGSRAKGGPQRPLASPSSKPATTKKRTPFVAAAALVLVAAAIGWLCWPHTPAAKPVAAVTKAAIPPKKSATSNSSTTTAPQAGPVTIAPTPFHISGDYMGLGGDFEGEYFTEGENVVVVVSKATLFNRRPPSSTNQITGVAAYLGVRRVKSDGSKYMETMAESETVSVEEKTKTSRSATLDKTRFVMRIGPLAAAQLAEASLCFKINDSAINSQGQKVWGYIPCVNEAYILGGSASPPVTKNGSSAPAVSAAVNSHGKQVEGLSSADSSALLDLRGRSSAAPGGVVSAPVVPSGNTPSPSPVDRTASTSSIPSRSSVTTNPEGFTNSLGMKFVPVPGTNVLFCIHKTRRKDYATMEAEFPGLDSHWKRASAGNVPVGDKDDHPVVSISHDEAEAFCGVLSKKEGRIYRLPTDEEWSYAVGIGDREQHGPGTTPMTLGGGLENDFPWGTVWPPPAGSGNFSDRSRLEALPQMQWSVIEGYVDGFATTSPVMSFKPNRIGLYDMAGNACEWVEDKAGPGTGSFVLRGSSWSYGSRGQLLSSSRRSASASSHSWAYGFRCVVVIDSLKPSIARGPEKKASNAVLSEKELRTHGAFEFPQEKARVFCDNNDLRFSVWNDSQTLSAQAILWKDNDSASGTDEKGGRTVDWSMLKLDLDADGKATPDVDRYYIVGPDSITSGPDYVISKGGEGNTTVKRDSSGHGSIRYLQTSEHGIVRVDTYSIPLKELSKSTSDKIRLCYWGDSPKPELTVNSTGYHPGPGHYYPYGIPFEGFHDYWLTPDHNPPRSTAGLPPELGVLDAEFQKLQAGGVDGPFNAEIWKLNENYVQSLEQAMEKERAAGHLEAVAALEKEKTTVKNLACIPSIDDGIPGCLEELRAAYRPKRARLTAARKTLAEFAAELDIKLVKLEIDLTKAGRVPDARSVRQYRQDLRKRFPMPAPAASPTTVESGSPRPALSTTTAASAAPAPAESSKMVQDRLRMLHAQLIIDAPSRAEGTARAMLPLTTEFVKSEPDSVAGWLLHAEAAAALKDFAQCQAAARQLQRLHAETNGNPLSAPVIAKLKGLPGVWPSVVPGKGPAVTMDSKGFVNSLGMAFLPVQDAHVLFCVCETRRKDYAAYAAEVPGVDGSWKEQSINGIPVGKEDDHPVVAVSYEDAVAFCAWLSKKEGRTYRLPTDKEWSYAVGIGHFEKWKKGTTPESLSGGASGKFPWGSAIGNSWPPRRDAGNYGDRSSKGMVPGITAVEAYGIYYVDQFVTTAPVMSFKANQAGLYDMGGNVWEWVEDWYNADKAQRVLRGGSWFDGAESMLLSSYRCPGDPGSRANVNGFRCVMEAESH